MNLRHAFWCCFDIEQFVWCLMDSLDRALIGSVKKHHQNAKTQMACHSGTYCESGARRVGGSALGKALTRCPRTVVGRAIALNSHASQACSAEDAA